MKFVSRYWAPIIAAIFIALLLMLAVRQLRYVEDMGEREKARLTRDLSETAGQLAEAIRDEFLVLPAVFRMDESGVERAIAGGDWNDFRHRWTTWKVYASDPSIVAGFHILDMAHYHPLGRVLSWDGTGFVREPSAELADSLMNEILSREKYFGLGAPPPLVSDDMAEPLDAKNLIWFIIRIDQDAVLHRLIPRLAEQYLNPKTDYYFRILDLNSNKVIYSSTDIENPELFAWPDMRFPLQGPLRPSFLSGSGQQFGIQALPGRMDQTNKDGPPSTRPLWVLEAVHRSGSLAAVVRSETIRNTVLSMGIIGLLASAFAILALAIRRQQEFADRQNEFIASITHELKTPIAVIRAAADNLADGVVRPERTAVYGGAIRRESGRLADTIDRLLTYARVGDGSQWNFETIDLRPLITRVVNAYRSDLENAHFEVDFSLPDTPVMISGDPVALEFAFGNLVTNALKHAREGLYLGVDVRIERKDQDPSAKRAWAVTSVSDRGPGVLRKESKLVFEAFYRGRSARTGQLPGSGIGLVLVRRVTEAHGGSVRLEGIGNNGSTFVIRLPLLEVRDGG